VVTSDIGQIVLMAVATDHRRQGIGRSILDELVSRAVARGLRQLHLETTASWHNARSFYERNGFRLRGVERSAFGDDAGYVLDLPT
jgi:ribosomal-protein-alanine N-acetyltransferase